MNSDLRDLHSPEAMTNLRLKISQELLEHARIGHRTNARAIVVATRLPVGGPRWPSLSLPQIVLVPSVTQGVLGCPAHLANIKKAIRSLRAIGLILVGPCQITSSGKTQSAIALLLEHYKMPNSIYLAKRGEDNYMKPFEEVAATEPPVGQIINMLLADAEDFIYNSKGSCV